MPPFLDHQALRKANALRRDGKLKEAERILMSATPQTPATLDELRKIASIRAWEAKKRGDWKAIIRILEGYTRLANKHRGACLRLVNQEPPGHTKTDLQLLAQARQK